MPRVEHNSSMPTSLHYALTDSHCSICGEQLEWQGDFDNISQPKYVSQHCNEDYAINIVTVKVEILRKASKDKQGQEQQKKFLSTNKEDEQPKALQMAEAMKRQQQQEEEEQPQVQDQQEQGDNPPNPT